MDPEPKGGREITHAVARLHYEQELSQREIAARLKVSTATVSRLIQKARDEGIVRIEIAQFVGNEELSTKLKESLQLDDVAIADAVSGDSMTSLSGPVGRVLSRSTLRPQGVIGFGWGRTVWDIVNGELPKLAGVSTTVPLCGGVPEAAAHHQMGEICRLAAKQFGGKPRFLHVPHLLAPAVRSAMDQDMRIRSTLDLWDNLDVAIVGIGQPHGGNHAPGELSLTPNDPVLATAAGDVMLRYFRANGDPLSWQGEEELIAIERDQLLRVPLRIGVAVSKEKAVSIVGAARSKAINVLVTDAPTANHLLNVLETQSN